MAANRKLNRKLTQDNFITEKIDVIKNKLLGSYNDNGEYIISDKIKTELIALPKHKRTSFGNSVFCVGSLLGYGELVFELNFDSKIHGDRNAAATLYILEDVDKINGYLQNTLKTKVDSFFEHVDDFMESTYNYFHIVKEEDDDDSEDEGRERKIIDDLENEDSFILAKKQYSLLLDSLLEEKFLDAYGKYFTARISELTKLDNNFSRTILDNFNKQYNIIQNLFLQEKNYKTLNELLDKCIEEVSGTSEELTAQEKEFNQNTAHALEVFTESINKLNDKYETKALNMLEKSDREKVEEILDSSIENENQVADNQPQQNQVETKENIKEIKASEAPIIKETPVTEIKETPQEKSEPIEESFYAKFKEQHSVQTDESNKKVVDTSISSAYENPDFHNETTLLNLKDRMNRLGKFKQDFSSLDSKESSSTVDSVISLLSRERAKKDEEIEKLNAENRQNILSNEEREL